MDASGILPGDEFIPKKILKLFVRVCFCFIAIEILWFSIDFQLNVPYVQHTELSCDESYYCRET